MAYTSDPDLEFLSTCSSEELDPLVRYIVYDSDGQARWNETLTGHVDYVQYKPDHSKYWRAVAAELQSFAGNSFANKARGHGVLYREALLDVCDKLDVNYNKKATTSFIEGALLQKILTDSLDRMTEDERRALVEELSLNTTDFTKEAVVAALQLGVKMSGFMMYRVALVVANSIARALLGRGLALATNRGIARAVGTFAGPVGWAVTAVWTAVDVSGAAYRVTIPSVIQVAFLRASKANANGA